jgi:hypothetical protein
MKERKMEMYIRTLEERYIVDYPESFTTGKEKRRLRRAKKVKNKFGLLK